MKKQKSLSQEIKEDFKVSPATAYIIIAIAGFLFFLPFLGKSHLFDWDEINFAEASREMIVTGDYMTVRIDYEPFHEKPPLFFWLQAASMHIFGINEFAARFPNVLAGIATLMFLFYVGRKVNDLRFGILWAAAYLGSFFPHFYFKTGLIDPIFNLFIFGSIYFLFRHYSKYMLNESFPGYYYILLAAVFSSLAVLTKGPVGFGLAGLAWAFFWLLNKSKYRFPWREGLLFIIISLLPMLLWYFMDFSNKGSTVFSDFINYQIRLLTTGDAGHSGPFYYHFIVLLIGCFPASVFALNSFRIANYPKAHQKEFKQWNIILLLVVLIIFSIVETKIIHYSSLAWLPISYLGAYGAYNIMYRTSRFKWNKVTLVALTILWSSALFFVPFIFIRKDITAQFIKDPLALEVLKADVKWLGFEPLVGILYILICIAGIIYMIKKNYRAGIYIYFAATAVALSLFLPLTVPKVDYYLQGAPIEFYKSKIKEDAYIQTLGFKSYAQHFYSMKKPDESLYLAKVNRDDLKEMLKPEWTDKPVYFVAKAHNANEFLAQEGIEKLYTKNGFVFMKRKIIRD